MRSTMFMFIITLACYADTDPSAQSEEPEDSLVPSVEQLEAQIEEARDPDVQSTQEEAIKLIEHFHGQEEVERFKQELLESKARELEQQLKQQEVAEKAAKAKAMAQAKLEAEKLKAVVEEAGK